MDAPMLNLPMTSVATSASLPAREARAQAWRAYPEADELAHAIQGTHLRITPSSRASGSWSLLPVALERGFVQFVDEPAAALTFGTIARDIAGFGVALSATGGYRMNGHVVSGNVFAMFGPGATHFASSAGPTRWASVSFAPVDLGNALGALRGGEPTTIGTVFRPVLAAQPAAAAVVELLFGAMAAAERDPNAFATSQARSGLERALLDAFARAVTSSESTAAPDRAKLPATRLVRLAEDYLDAHLHTPVYVADLCAVTGASERTLRNAFHSVYGVGPTRYLVYRRLATARRALRHAQAGDTVTAIATHNGLWDLGRFAADYRSLYGEPPSATLRAARGGALAA
jgi:AraC family transcriptional regulator, ethanolamine operon transcriptional activator